MGGFALLHAPRQAIHNQDSTPQGAPARRSNMTHQRQASARGAKRSPFRPTMLAAAVVMACGATGVAQAFDINTGNEDLSARWDNTVRYNLGSRVSEQDAAILANPNADDGDRNFDKGSLVTNRLDLLSEFDLVWQRKYGLRLSAAGWYDAAYSRLDNTSTATANTLVDGLPVAGALSPYTKRYAKGASAEMLDWFVFGNFDVGGVPVSARLGQHTAYWGESLLLGGLIHGIAYSQNSVDAWKLQATPGSEAKEFIRPRGGLTIQAQPTQDLSLAAQWFYNWQAVRSPESGSYLAGSDPLTFGGDSFITGPNPFAAMIPGAPAALRMWNAQAVPKSRNSASLGDFGVSARWSPQWLDGTLGFYGRNTTDILPQLMLTPGVASLPAATCTAIGGTVLSPTTCLVNQKATTVGDLQKYGKAGTYQTAYGNNIHLYGLSLSKNVAGISVGSELSYRQNMPLVSDAVSVVPAALVPGVPGSIATTAVPDNYDTPAARGSTWHGLINGTYVVPQTPLFDTAVIASELTWMYLDKITQNAAVYKGRDNYVGVDKPTSTYWGLGVNFTPTWYQVLAGVDLSMPLTWSQGIRGNAATTFGGNKGTGTWSVGLGATIQQTYLVSLSYIDYFGKYDTNPATGAATAFNGSSAAISDRGWVSLTFKTTF
jgi:Protein of unknown function (DUF1302)